MAARIPVILALQSNPVKPSQTNMTQIRGVSQRFPYA